MVRPASLVQEPLKAAPVVSVSCVWSGVQVVGSLRSSLPDVLMVTSPMGDATMAPTGAVP